MGCGRVGGGTTARARVISFGRVGGFWGGLWGGLWRWIQVVVVMVGVVGVVVVVVSVMAGFYRCHCRG
jgi:hypothetical protein